MRGLLEPADAQRRQRSNHFDPFSVSVLVGDQVVSISLQNFGRHEPTEFVLERLAREAESAMRG
jgi:hypothetical protein